ncbi:MULTISPECIES: hypothetical protein [Rhizobium]|uniref:hypothetical protein n=1 Tax=Rhizobium TaxID=379 RepID=UPI0021B09496|nr:MULTISPECIES: hypothetical protein [Rhizobium]
MRKENINSALTEEATAAISAAHLLHPEKHLNHPQDVLAAEHIGTDEKRAILASRASDRFAIESIPALRLYPGTEKEVSYDEILDALKALDEENKQPAGRSSSVSGTFPKTYPRQTPASLFKALGL